VNGTGTGTGTGTGSFCLYLRTKTMSYLYIAKCQGAVEEKGCRRIDCTGLKIFIPGWLFHECFKRNGLRSRLPSNVNHSGSNGNHSQKL